MRISQLRSHEKLEVFVVINHIISYFDAEYSCVLEGLLCEDWIKNGVDFFFYILDN